MIIDQNLRAAIRSAEKAQRVTSEYEARRVNERKAIDTFLKKHPAKARRIKTLVATAEAAERKATEARLALCQDYGLRKYDGELAFGNCDNSHQSFIKAGGVIPTTERRWTFDAAVAELAAAAPKGAKAILKKYGINWT